MLPPTMSQLVHAQSVLGINQHTTLVEMNNIRRTKLLNHHPDRKNGSNSDAKEINSAYDLLRVPSKLEPNTKIMLHGLKNNTHFNGTCGRVLSEITDNNNPRFLYKVYVEVVNGHRAIGIENMWPYREDVWMNKTVTVQLPPEAKEDDQMILLVKGISTEFSFFVPNPFSSHVKLTIKVPESVCLTTENITVKTAVKAAPKKPSSSSTVPVPWCIQKGQSGYMGWTFYVITARFGLDTMIMACENAFKFDMIKEIAHELGFHTSEGTKCGLLSEISNFIKQQEFVKNPGSTSWSEMLFVACYFALPRCASYCMIPPESYFLTFSKRKMHFVQRKHDAYLHTKHKIDTYAQWVKHRLSESMQKYVQETESYHWVPKEDCNIGDIINILILKSRESFVITFSYVCDILMLKLLSDSKNVDKLVKILSYCTERTGQQDEIQFTKLFFHNFTMNMNVNSFAQKRRRDLLPPFFDENKESPTPLTD